MARSVNQIVAGVIGDQVIQIAQLQSIVEQQDETITNLQQRIGVFEKINQTSRGVVPEKTPEKTQGEVVQFPGKSNTGPELPTVD